MKTLGAESIELEVANAIAKYHREQQGKVPGRISVHLNANVIVVLTSEMYTPQEERLSRDEDGRKAIKSARRELRSLTRESAHALIASVVGCPVLRSYWDLDVRIGEQAEVYVLAKEIA